MTRARYEIEFQGTRDGVTWIAYPFRYKPQDPTKRPGIYAPYQPRFEWNLWFASLGSWRDDALGGARPRSGCSNASPPCSHLFARDPFAGRPAARGARGALAVLVHQPGGAGADRRLVAPGAPGLYAPEVRRGSNGETGTGEPP